jgi:hypothetical protein
MPRGGAVTLSDIRAPTRGQRTRKYHHGNLIPALRPFIAARNKAIESGFTDNGGAIHSVERILDILSLHLRYPRLSHINNLKNDPEAEISKAALKARLQGQPLYIEHVLPQRAYAQEVIALVNAGATDDDLAAFIRANYRLVLLTQDETERLNQLNRSRITKDRITDAGIRLRSTRYGVER